MARCQSVLFAALIFHIVLRGLAGRESLQVMVGDPLPFAVTENCRTEKSTIVHLDVGRPVAEREGGVWRPAEDYRDRVNQDSTFTLRHTFYTDTGLYELTCDGEKVPIYVFVAANLGASLTEGQAGTLPCYFSRDELSNADSVLWEKNRETVLELNLSTGKITHGTGFSEEDMSLHPEGKKDGNFSLILPKPQKEDGGDYFCSLLKDSLKVNRGQPAAVRTVIKERDPDQTTTCPTPPPRGSTDGQSSTETGCRTKILITAVVVAVLVILGAVLSIFLYRRGCWPKSRGASESSGSSGPGSAQTAPLNGVCSSSNGGNLPNGVV